MVTVVISREMATGRLDGSDYVTNSKMHIMRSLLSLVLYVVAACLLVGGAQDFPSLTSVF